MIWGTERVRTTSRMDDLLISTPIVLEGWASLLDEACAPRSGAARPTWIYAWAPGWFRCATNKYGADFLIPQQLGYEAKRSSPEAYGLDGGLADAAAGPPR